MKVLILGGSGLIGTGIARLLSLSGHSVTVFSRTRPAGLAPNVAHIAGDRRDHAWFVGRFRRGRRYDAVIDLLTYTQADAVSLVEAFRGRTGQLIFCSTIEVYAKTAQLPVTESTPRDPITEYGSSKVIAEDHLTRAAAAGAFGLTILRPAYTYGEGKPLLYALGDTPYLGRIASGRPIVVPGDGTTAWVACHRDDVATAFVAAVGNARTFGKAYNVSGHQPMSWNEFHERVGTIVRAPAVTLVHLPTDLLCAVLPRRLRYPERQHIFSFNYSFDTTAARRELGFAPEIGLEEGVGRLRDSAHPVEPRSSRLLHQKLLTSWQAAHELVVSHVRPRPRGTR